MRTLRLLVLVMGMAAAHQAAAQDPGAMPAETATPQTTTPQTAMPQTDWPPLHVEPPLPDEPVGVTVLDGPEAGTRTVPTTPPMPEPEIGLIEAPESTPGLAADAAGLGADPFADDATVSSFAERRTAQARTRMFGPIGHPPVVVELFTSQGCSSCPPADEMLGNLADRDDILALSWHVDYWDYLGLADEFARPEFTARQQAYAHASGERAIYTPQMIVGGTDTLIAARPAELLALVDMQMARPAPVLVTSSQAAGDGYQIEMTPRAALRQPVAILLVRYAPERRVTIRAGENRGIVVNYRNVVLAVDRIGAWDGRAPLRMTVKADASPGDVFPDDTRHAILAQQVGRDQTLTGPILAAVRLD